MVGCLVHSMVMPRGVPAPEIGPFCRRFSLGSCRRSLRIIPSTPKPATMSSFHHSLRGHCHGTTPLCLPTRSRGAGMRLPAALRAVAQRRRFPAPADRANRAIPTHALQGTPTVGGPASATAVRPVCVSLAAVAQRAQPFSRTAPARSSAGSGRRGGWVTDGVRADGAPPSGPASAMQCLL